PNWDKNFSAPDFIALIKKGNKKGGPLSLYFHIPFCEERCTFCACSVVATKKHAVTTPYLKSLFREIEIMGELVDRRRPVEQIHWGGGTPTYLTCEQIEQLYKKITTHFHISPTAEISIEVDPRVTSKEQIQTLRALGFNRMSLGVQDFEPAVQKEAGRVQSEEETKAVIDCGRALHFDSINIDLVYGLPKQTESTFHRTVQKVIALNPNRVALFHFAHVPWMHAHQRKMSEKDLPTSMEKMRMFCNAIEQFREAGYEFIGLDHFAKQDDELTKARREGTMYRNFQGYTTKADCELIGMGVTSISTLDGCLAQNAKKLKEYEEGIQKGLTTQTGKILSEDDIIRNWVICEIFCHQNINKEKFKKAFNKNFDSYFKSEIARLKPLEEDGFLTQDPRAVSVTPLGRLFLRNIGMIFDAYLQTGAGKFSKTA
ncbi:MAG: oxygen-independent coproporphyrinogen III oxidase, partial [Deltaproteobacteria bacterium]|nr:oxygen-independent coproporphyrinogen III oxidase [Deltaproteobacteria bacterium]